MFGKLFPDKPVLIVEDRVHVMNSYDFTLRSHGITNVECCRYSWNLLQLLEYRKFSVILLDLKMPCVNGFELLPQIIDNYPETPVIVLTGLRVSKIRENCLNAGASAYLEKPVRPELLIGTIKRVLSPGEKAA